jgi:lipoprotein NlpD
MMLKVGGVKTSQSLALAAMIVLVAGCAPSKVPAPVENRTVFKTKPSTKAGASEIRASSTDPVPSGFYRVRKGDTLIGISLDHGVSWRDLADWNGLQNPNLIEVDQLIRINPPGAESRVASVSPRSAPAAPSAPATSTTEVRPINPGQSQSPSMSQSQPSAQALPPSSPQPAKQTASAAASASGSPILSWPSNGRVITQFADPGYKGVALSGQEGDPVFAAGDGRVVYSGSGLRGYGNLVIVKHDGDFLTAYAHNRKILVNEGQTVKRGQQIAELGSTDSDIPKLHFEVRLSGKPVDPMRYLAQR